MHVLGHLLLLASTLHQQVYNFIYLYYATCDIYIPKTATYIGLQA